MPYLTIMRRALRLALHLVYPRAIGRLPGARGAARHTRREALSESHQ